MRKTLCLKNETKKTQLIFLFSIINSLIFMLIYFLTIKLTIMYYGEAINGVVRFANQFILYFLVLQGSVFLIFQIKIISFYNNGEIEKIAFIFKYLKVITKRIALGFLIFISSVAWIPSFFLANGSVNINLVYFLFIALSANIFFALFFFDKINILLLSTNKGYVVYLVRTMIKPIFFAYFLVVVLAYPPELIYVFEKGQKIWTFAPGSTPRVYALCVGYFLLGMEPIFSSIILKIFIKKNNKEYFNFCNEKYLAYKKEIKKEIFSGVAKGLILNFAFLVIFSTDEFVMLLFKNKMGGLAVLKFISIYGLYVSIANTLRFVITNYIMSKKTLMGYSKIKKVHKKIMMNIRTNTHLLASFFFIFSTLVLPFFVSFLFAPNFSNQYVNFKLSIPIGILGWIVIANTPNQIEMEVDNNLKVLIIIFTGEAILNIFLSTTLSIYTGVIYWILWASVFAGVFKLGIFEIYIAFNKNKKNGFRQYTSQFLLFLNKKTIFTFFVLLLTAVLLVMDNFYSFGNISWFFGNPHSIDKLLTFIISPLLSVFVISTIGFIFYKKKLTSWNKLGKFKKQKN